MWKKTTRGELGSYLGEARLIRRKSVEIYGGRSCPKTVLRRCSVKATVVAVCGKGILADVIARAPIMYWVGN